MFGLIKNCFTNFFYNDIVMTEFTSVGYSKEKFVQQWPRDTLSSRQVAADKWWGKGKLLNHGIDSLNTNFSKLTWLDIWYK